MKTVIVIPSRHGSTRFPGKSLALLGGKPLVQWVWEAAQRSKKAQRVVVATDDDRIAVTVRAFGGEAIMTSPRHISGTDRIAEVAGKVSGELYVNVQGDEPLMQAREIDRLIAGLGKAEMATMAREIEDEAEILNPNIVKVVSNRAGEALYFSRSPLPHVRDKAEAAFVKSWQHIGIYAYRAEALRQFVRWKPSPLEQAEKLEQLRALENGMTIRVIPTKMRCVGVDTPADLRAVEHWLMADPSARKRR